MSKSICIDDFGNEVHKCHWTGQLVSIADAVITGGFMPGVKSKFIAIKDHRAAMKQSHRDFNDMDANCNTCKNLSRVNAEKSKHGFLYGTCNIKTKEIMTFHPDDYMGMPCYEQR